MKLCAQECFLNNKNCHNNECRLWIDYKEDLNCCLIAIEKNGKMTLEETGKRLNISYVRVTQIEKSTIDKLQKKVV
jgi:hypothetical protein